MTFVLRDSPSTNPRIRVKYGLQNLAEHYQIVKPKLRWSHGRIHGIYRAQDDLIIMGSEDAMGVDSSLVHCFAHVLLHKTRMVKERHGIEFCEALWDISLFYFKGDPERYSWWGDRANVFEFGRNRIKQLISDREWLGVFSNT